MAAVNLNEISQQRLSKKSSSIAKKAWCIFSICILSCTVCVPLISYIIYKYDFVSNACEVSFSAPPTGGQTLHILFTWMFSWSQVIDIQQQSPNQDAVLNLCNAGLFQIVCFILTNCLVDDLQHNAVNLKNSMTLLGEFLISKCYIIMLSLVGITTLCLSFVLWRKSVKRKTLLSRSHQKSDSKYQNFKLGESSPGYIMGSDLTPDSLLSAEVDLVRPPSSTMKSSIMGAPTLKRRVSEQKSLVCTLFMCLVGLTVSAVLVSIPWEFVRLYQAQIARRASHVLMGSPPECSPHSLTMLASLKSVLRAQFSWNHSEDPCYNYHYALLVDPLWDVSPLTVVSSVLTRCLLHPLELLSTSMGRNLTAFFSEIPAQWQPLIMLIVMATVLVLLLVLSRYRLSIPLLLRIEPKTPQSSPRDVREGSYYLDKGRANHSAIESVSLRTDAHLSGKNNTACNNKTIKNIFKINDDRLYNKFDKKLEFSDESFELENSKENATPFQCNIKSELHPVSYTKLVNGNMNKDMKLSHKKAQKFENVLSLSKSTPNPNIDTAKAKVTKRRATGRRVPGASSKRKGKGTKDVPWDPLADGYAFSDSD